MKEVLAEVERLFSAFETSLHSLHDFIEGSCHAGVWMPGLLEGCLQYHSAAARVNAGAVCKEWYLSNAKLTRKEADAYFAEVSDSRAGARIVEETLALRAGRGRSQQRVRIIDVTGKLNGQEGVIMHDRQPNGGEQYQVMLGWWMSRERGETYLLKADCLEAARWTGLSVPMLEAASRQLKRQLFALHAASRLSDPLLVSTPGTSASQNSVAPARCETADAGGVLGVDTPRTWNVQRVSCLAVLGSLALVAALLAPRWL